MFSNLNKINTDKLVSFSTMLFFFLIPVATSPAEISGIILLVINIVSRRLNLSKITSFFKTDIGIAVLVFVLLHWIGLLWTSDLNSGISFAKRSLIWVYALVIFAINPNDEEKKRYIFSFLLGLITTSLIVIAQSIGIIPVEDFPRGFIKHITLSVMLAFGIWVVSFVYKLSDNHMRFVCVTAILLFLTALMLGIGRIGFAILIIGLPFIISNILGRIRPLIVIPLAILVVIITIILSPTLEHRIKAVFDDIKEYKGGNPNTSIGLRLYMWDKALVLIKEKPLFGHGTGSYSNEIVRHRSDNIDEIFLRISQPHNSLLYMMVSFGILGFLSFFMLFFVVIRRAYMQRNTLVGYAIFVFNIVLLLSTTTDNQILSFGTSHLFALFTGMLLTYKG
ncbi:MAG: O-antigen ligase family protein [Thermodesulfovibrionales bacterium]|nr:O-antigen ligase family protein [Thermodesulfovibrionales bacterium]